MKILKRLPFYTYLGIFLILFMETAIVLAMDNVTTWATPVFWTGLILFCDGVLYARKNRSLIKSGLILPLALISIISWWIFEWFNIFLSNWHYENLGESLAQVYIGYFWAFATIIPGILLVYGLLLLVLREKQGRGFSVGRKTLTIMFFTGLFFLAIPIIPFSMYHADRAADESLFIWLTWAADTRLSEYTAAYVWTGFVLILEPLNYSMGNRSLLCHCSLGNYRPLIALTLAGLICGFLWEFWNYWAYTKWNYTVPILGHIKIFEMPVLGYFGFIPFAWELYAMVSIICPRALDIIEGES